MQDAAIQAEGLRKSYGDVQALDGIDLEAPAGTILGLLGPNGAGKTTAVRILTTLLPPDGGTARVAGLDVVRDAAKLRAQIGLAGQYAAVDENLSGHENLEMVGRLYHMGRAASRERAGELLERFDLADRLADRIAVIDQGRVIAEGTFDELKDRVGGEWLEVTLDEVSNVQTAISALTPMVDDRPSCDGTLLHLPIRRARGAIAEAVRRLDGAGVGIDDIYVRRPTLDDVFLELTGHTAEEAAEDGGPAERDRREEQAAA